MSTQASANDQYYIADTQSRFYRLGASGELIVAMDHEAQLFSLQEARKKIGKGKRARYYKTVPATGKDGPAETGTGDDGIKPQEDARETSGNERNIFRDITDLANVDWVELLENLSYAGTMLPAYRDQLREDQSRNDLLITDLLHRVEICENTEEEILELMDQIRQTREERRIIKNELFRVEKFQGAIGTKAIIGSAKDALRQIRDHENGIYRPRTAPHLFEGRQLKPHIKHTCYANRDAFIYGRAETVENQETDEGPVQEEMDMLQQEGYVYERVGTPYDTEKPDWKQLVQLQVDFFRYAPQYINDLQFDIGRYDSEIEEALQKVESSNYNAAQGAKALKELKELRLARKNTMYDLFIVRAIAGRFECDAMLDVYEDIQKEFGGNGVTEQKNDDDGKQGQKTAG